MVREIIPEHSRRADAFALWNRAPMPMVTLMKTLDVTHLAGALAGQQPGWRTFISFQWGTS